MLLTCDHASFAYDNGVVLSDVSFSVEDADYLCIVGENGSGKSTLMKGILGLLRPSSGSITLAGGLGQDEIGYLPQQKAAQRDFPASVYEVVLSGRLARLGAKPFYTKKDKEAAKETIRMFGMREHEKHCYRELSAGQQQRVLLARALCAAQKLLLLDEPAAGLDPLGAAELYRTVDALNKEQGVAIIMVSHDIESAVTHARHILHLQGKQIFMGTAAEYTASPEGRKFLGGAVC